MPRDPRAYLWDVLDAIRNVERFVHGQSIESFTQDVLVQSAVERQLEIIGEALNQLARVAPEVAAQIPELRRIVGLRNLLIHGYAVVNHELVWQAIHQKLPDLQVAVRLQMSILGEK